MASTWTLTRNKIIKRAYRIIGVLPSGQELTAGQLSDGIEAFESLLKSLGDENIFLYKVDWTVKSLNSTNEVIGTDALNYKCYRQHVATADNCPITGSQYKAYWRQEGTAGVPWVLNTQYNYLGNISVDSDIVRIMKLFYRDSNNSDITISLVDREEYSNITTKSDAGTYPSVAWHNKEEGILYVWPVANTSSDYTLHIQAQRIIDDLVAPDTIPDAKTNMYEMLAFGLAYKLSFENIIPLDERNFINAEYEKLKAWKKTNNRDDEESNFKIGAY